MVLIEEGDLEVDTLSSCILVVGVNSGIDLYPIQEEKGKESLFGKGSRSRRVGGRGTNEKLDRF